MELPCSAFRRLLITKKLRIWKLIPIAGKLPVDVLCIQCSLLCHLLDLWAVT